MHFNCQRKFLPILNKVPYWYIFRFRECKCYGFSVAVTRPRSLETNEVSSENENVTSSNNKESKLDTFTDRLVQQRVNKLNLLNIKRRDETIENQGSVHLEQQEERHIDDASKFVNIQKSRIKFNEDIKQFLHKCLTMKIVPERHTLNFFSYLCAQRGDKASILIIKNISEFLDSEDYKQQSCYNVYLAEAVWRTGHFEDALTLFWNVYAENTGLQNNIKHRLRILIAETLSKKGEAVLVLITNFSKMFVDTYSDFTCLSCVWEHCFLSEWHSDNQFAASLLDKYPELKASICLRVHHISSKALTSHKLDIVQRLFEVLLKFEMKTQYELVLRSLFDYVCSEKDLYACTKIVQSCYDLDVTLTEMQKERFLQLFCQEDAQKLPIKTWTIKPSKFIFKF